ncbi:isochorismatase family protein [Candidatus Foliamicus sp.]
MAELDHDYSKAGFGGSIAPGARPALLIIDFVRAYLDPECSLYAGVEKEQEQAVLLLGECRKAGIPVFHTCVEYDPAGVEGGVFYRKVPALANLVKGSRYCAFGEGLEPAADEVVITKKYPSAFFGTHLAATLAAMGVDTLLICGLTTSGCVRASAVDAMQHGYIPVVVREATGDRDERPHEANLFDISKKFGEVIGMDQAREYLAGL